MKIALVGFRGAQSLDLVGPLEVFAMANELAGSEIYRPILSSPDGGELVCSSGLRIAGCVPLSELPDDLDTIIIAGGSELELRAARDSGIVEWLGPRARSTRRVASVCSGAFVLAAAGLLDGRRATTHWNACEQMRAFRPAVHLEPDAIYVADPPFFTSAGVTAGIDLCLSFVEMDRGAELALAVARSLVLFMRRPGGQTQYSAGLNVQSVAEPRLHQVVTQIAADPSGDQSVSSLAERAGMAERTFSRLFHKSVGTSPAAFVEAARVNRAKAFLEVSSWPLARVAERTGFGSLDSMHRAFLKRVGTTPGEYRERFGMRTGTARTRGAAR